MTLNYYNSFSEDSEEDNFEEDYFEEDNFEEDNFEESDVELYRNKQNFQTVFSSQLFGKEGKYFFPGTYDEAALLTTILCEFKDQEHLFSMHRFSPLLRDKIKNWSYSKLTCSVLYYYLNIEIAKNNLNSQDWNIIADLIQSPAISQDIFSFVNRHNIVNFSSKNNLILGFMNSLMFPPYISYCNNLKPMLEVKILYRFLKLANVEKSIIRDLIKITITQQNKKAIVRFLENQFQ